MIIHWIKAHWQIALLSGLIIALWTTPALVPLKILIVLLHELSHAGATVLTGGSVVSLTVDAQQGGQVLSLGGNRFLTLSAGYVGSLALGVALFVIAVRTHFDRFMLGILGGLILLCTALYVRDGFALLFCGVTGAAMIAIARFLWRDLNDLILRLIGLTSMIYVPLDIFSDTISRAHLQSDAWMLAEEIGGTTMFWGGVWLAISLVVICACLCWGLGDNSNVSLRRPIGSDDQRT